MNQLIWLGKFPVFYPRQKMLIYKKDITYLAMFYNPAYWKVAMFDSKLQIKLQNLYDIKSCYV